MTSRAPLLAFGVFVGLWAGLPAAVASPPVPLPHDVLSIAVVPARVRPGATARVSGRLRGPAGPIAGQIIELQEAIGPRRGFSDIAHTRTRADGSYRFTRLWAPRTLRYRVKDVAPDGPSSRSMTLTVEVPVPVYPASSSVISAARYLGMRTGMKAFAVIDNKGKLAGVDVHLRFHSASVVKSMLLVAYLQTLAYEHRGLDSVSTGLLYPMIHSSDNDAASEVFTIVGDSGLDRVARQAGMVDFATGGGWWGFTEISAADMARFFYVQDSLIPGQFDGYARSLLSSIEPSQSWGVPAVARPEFQVFFKGGWLPMSEGLVNQAARLERPHDTFAMAVLSSGDPSMDYGEETIAGVTARLLGR